MWMFGDAKDFDCDFNSDGIIDFIDGDINNFIGFVVGVVLDFDINVTLVENIVQGDLIFLFVISNYIGGDAIDLEMQFYIGVIPQPGFPDECNDVPVE